MLRFFPMPYPDESLYSIFSRYNILTGNNNYRITAKELTGCNNPRITQNYANNLSFLCNQLPANTIFNVDYFIENHTVLPIYKSFVQEKRFEVILNNIDNLDEYNILQSIGYISLFNSNCISYCPECIKEDKKIYGEAYIHRKHQVDGNFICYKHKTLLNVYPLPESKHYYFHDINKINLNNCNDTSNIFYKELLNLSYDIDLLFQNYSKLPNYSLVREKYFSILSDKGYFFKNGLVNQARLHNDFINYYSKNYLMFLNLYPETNKISWIKKVLLNITSLRSYHPIKHLLLINFLFGNITNFLNYQIKNPLDYYDFKNMAADKSKKNYYINKEIHQSNIIKLLEQEPNLLRKQIYKRIPTSYQWLIRNEKDWLETILPKPNYQNRNAFDWSKRDMEIYLKTLGGINHILAKKIPERITVDALSKHINYNFTKENLEKMPKTKGLIEKYRETYPDFNIRKTEAFLREMITYYNP